MVDHSMFSWQLCIWPLDVATGLQGMLCLGCNYCSPRRETTPAVPCLQGGAQWWPSGAPAGQPPRGGAEPVSVTAQGVAQVANGFRRPHPPHWPAALKAVVGDCLEQDPSDRPSAAQVGATCYFSTITCFS